MLRRYFYYAVSVLKQGRASRPQAFLGMFRKYSRRMARRGFSYGRVISAGLVVALFAVYSTNSSVLAQASGDTMDLVKQRCSSAQVSLQQISKRDAVSRINRGRSYDQMLRQVSAMNSRFAYNKVSTPDLVEVTSDLQSSIDIFRTDYDHYLSGLTEAIKMNCKDNPDQFYQHVTDARADRSAVGEQIKTINNLIAKYREALIAYKDKT